MFSILLKYNKRRCQNNIIFFEKVITHISTHIISSKKWVLIRQVILRYIIHHFIVYFCLFNLTIKFDFFFPENVLGIDVKIICSIFQIILFNFFFFYMSKQEREII